MERISENIRLLRKKSGLTQSEMADLLGFKRSTYASYENGVASITLENLLIISNYHGISINDIVYSDLSNVQLQNFNKTNGGTKYKGKSTVESTVERTAVRENPPEYLTETNKEKEELLEQKKRALEIDSDPRHHNPKPGYHYSRLDPKGMTREWLEQFIESQRETINAQHDHIQLLKRVLNKIEEERSENTQKKNDK